MILAAFFCFFTNRVHELSPVHVDQGTVLKINSYGEEQSWSGRYRWLYPLNCVAQFQRVRLIYLVIFLTDRSDSTMFFPCRNNRTCAKTEIPTVTKWMQACSKSRAWKHLRRLLMMYSWTALKQTLIPSTLLVCPVKMWMTQQLPDFTSPTLFSDYFLLVFISFWLHPASHFSWTAISIITTWILNGYVGWF